MVEPPGYREAYRQMRRLQGAACRERKRLGKLAQRRVDRALVVFLASQILRTYFGLPYGPLLLPHLGLAVTCAMAVGVLRINLEQSRIFCARLGEAEAARENGRWVVPVPSSHLSGLRTNLHVASEIGLVVGCTAVACWALEQAGQWLRGALAAAAGGAV